MKKILVIPDWDEFWLKIEHYFKAAMKADVPSLLKNTFDDYELKDVIEFEATVICQEKTLGAGKFINAKIPDNLDVGNGDKLHVFAIKLKEEPDDQKP